jgi:hypothetical protein
MDFTTGTTVPRWVVRVNASKLTVPDGGAASLTAAAAEQFNFYVTAETAARVTRAGGYTFHTYPVYAGRIGFDAQKLNYESLVMDFTAPDGFNQGGIAVERYLGGVLQKRTEFNSGRISTYLDTELTQNTEYEYGVTGYDTLSLDVAASPRILFALSGEGVTTRKGNPPVATGLLIAAAAALALSVLLYTFRFQIFRNPFKKRTDKVL